MGSDEPGVALAAATEELNEALRDAEDALASLSVGSAAEVALPSGSVLSFRKRGSQWGLWVRHGDDPQGQEVVSVLRASRGVRVEAARALPALHGAILLAADSHAREVASAAEAARAFVSSLRRSSGPAGSWSHDDVPGHGGEDGA